MVILARHDPGGKGVIHPPDDSRLPGSERSRVWPRWTSQHHRWDTHGLSQLKDGNINTDTEKAAAQQYCYL
jgi:hypothetical protein